MLTSITHDSEGNAERTVENAVPAMKTQSFYGKEGRWQPTDVWRIMDSMKVKYVLHGPCMIVDTQGWSYHCGWFWLYCTNRKRRKCSNYRQCSWKVLYRSNWETEGARWACKVVYLFTPLNGDWRKKGRPMKQISIWAKNHRELGFFMCYIQRDWWTSFKRSPCVRAPGRNARRCSG